MEEKDYSIVTSYGVLEAVSIISAITRQACIVDNQKAIWQDNEYISVDFNKMPGDILFDLDSSEMNDSTIDDIIFELSILDIGYYLKLYDNIAYVPSDHGFDFIQDYIKSFDDSPLKIWYEGHKDKMDYAEFEKQHPQLFV